MKFKKPQTIHDYEQIAHDLFKDETGSKPHPALFFYLGVDVLRRLDAMNRALQQLKRVDEERWAAEKHARARVLEKEAERKNV